MFQQLRRIFLVFQSFSIIIMLFFSFILTVVMFLIRKPSVFFYKVILKTTCTFSLIFILCPLIMFIQCPLLLNLSLQINGTNVLDIVVLTFSKRFWHLVIYLFQIILCFVLLVCVVSATNFLFIVLHIHILNPYNYFTLMCGDLLLSWLPMELNIMSRLLMRIQNLLGYILFIISLRVKMCLKFLKTLLKIKLDIRFMLYNLTMQKNISL